MGDRPTHPEMLDWLACEFIQKGFSVKSLHRLVVTSHTYRQRSAVTLQQVQLDPDNRLLSRMPMRRMEAESLRDTLLLIAGQLNDTEFGPAEAVKVRDDGLVLSGNRRSIYVQQLRRQAVSLLEIFDLPSMNPNCLQRPESLVAPQALHLMNDAVIRGLASQFADRAILSAGRQVARNKKTACNRCSYWPTNGQSKCRLSGRLPGRKRLVARWQQCVIRSSIQRHFFISIEVCGEH